MLGPFISATTWERFSFTCSEGCIRCSISGNIWQRMSTLGPFISATIHKWLFYICSEVGSHCSCSRRAVATAASLEILHRECQRWDRLYQQLYASDFSSCALRWEARAGVLGQVLGGDRRQDNESCRKVLNFQEVGKKVDSQHSQVH